MAYDLSMDTVMAANWKREVDAEIEATDNLLKKVAELCQEVPGEDDTMMQAIYNVGTELNNTWTTLGNTLRQVQDKCTDIIDTVNKTGEKGVELFNQYKSNGGFR